MCNKHCYLHEDEDICGVYNKWRKCVRPETEQQKFPITIQIEQRLHHI